MATEEEIQKSREALKKTIDRGFKEEEINEEVEKYMVGLSDKSKQNKIIKEIKRIGNNYLYSIIKESIKKQWNLDSSLRFFINKNCRLRGKITNVIENGIVEIPLIHQGEQNILYKGDYQLIRKVFVFGERRNKDFEIKDTLNHKFYMYRMIVKEKDNLEPYMILSETPLEFEEYLIEGMLMDLDDFSDVSKYTRIMKKSHVVFVNNITPAKKIYENHNQLLEELEKLNLNEDSFFQNLFCISQGKQNLYFRHPRYFEKLIAAFCLSTKYDSSPYPLHLLMIGKQGGGKSKVMEALDERMSENIPIVEGSGSTMKSLIPSFRGDMTKPGTLIESNRMSFVDEFFRILMRVDKDDRENTLTHMNPLLEHKKRRFGSGNNFLDGCMTAKLFSVTNPVFGTSNMDYLTHKLDNSFLSRLMIWYQDEEHWKQIVNSTEEQLIKVENPINQNIFISIYDYCNSFKADFERERFDKIYKSGAALITGLSGEVNDLYSSRYKHHLACLLDGIIKLRCIIEKDMGFLANEDDYDTTSGIWFKMLENWKKGIRARFNTREGRVF